MILRVFRKPTTSIRPSSRLLDDQKWKVIQSVGKTSLELRDGGEIDEEEARKERAKRLKAAGIKISDEDILSDDDESKKEGEMSEIVEIPCYLSRLSISTPSPLRLR